MQFDRYSSRNTECINGKRNVVYHLYLLKCRNLVDEIQEEDETMDVLVDVVVRLTSGSSGSMMLYKAWMILALK